MEIYTPNQVVFLSVLEFKGRASTYIKSGPPNKFLQVISVSEESYNFLVEKDPFIAVNRMNSDVFVYTTNGCSVPIGDNIRFELKKIKNPKRAYSLHYFPPNIKKCYSISPEVDEFVNECKRVYSKTLDEYKGERYEDNDDRRYRREERRYNKEEHKELNDLLDDIKLQLLDVNMKIDRLKSLYRN